MNADLPDRLELRQRKFLASRTQRWVLSTLGLLAAAILATVVIIILYKLSNGGRDGAALLAKLVRNPVDAVINTLFLLAVVLQLGYLRLAQQHERLILTRTGIEYRSPLPGALQALRPSWSLAWSEMRATTLQGAKHANDARRMALEFDCGSLKVKIFPFQWVEATLYRPASPWTAMRKLRAATPAEHIAYVEESAVLRYIAIVAPQLMPARSTLNAAAGFALEKNPHALAAVVLFFALLFYALGDTFFFGHEIYADQPPYGFFFVAGILVASAAVVWLRRALVPKAESLGVALLFGAALGAALYPSALRVNAYTDVDGLRFYEYQLTRDLRLTPLSAGLPTLAFPRYADYWSRLKTGSVHYFELRRGGLGFYQLNMLPVENTLRGFYEGQNHGGGAMGRQEMLRKI